MSECQKITKQYSYDGKRMKTFALYFPYRSIATITETTDDVGDLDTQVLEHGMEREELMAYFPATGSAKKKGSTFNLAAIIRSIIYEAYEKEGQSLDAGNVRNFWYTHLKATITRVLGLGESSTVISALNQAWGAMINSGLVTYEGLNIVGGKEAQRISIVKDSPFSNLIVAVEKADYFEHLSWVPKLFNCTLITAGGQPSRAVARGFVFELQEIGVDLNQQFEMCVTSDLDPAGYYIQDAFRKQLESAIEFYGGSGTVNIRRLFVRRDQVTQNLLDSEAMPCQDQANTESAKKAEDSKWEYFVNETDGGLYIPVPPDYDGGVYEIDGRQVVRALLEMNAFPKQIIEKAILKELLSIIVDTNDESKIMIPEIMRVFEIMREEAIEEVYNEWKEKLIDPLIKRFLADTKVWENEISQTYYNDWNEAEEKRDDAYKPIDDKYDQEIVDKEQEARDQEPELYEKQEDLEGQIAKLKVELEETKDEIDDKCSEIFEEIEDLEEQRRAEKEPHKELFQKELQAAEKRRNFRKEKLQEFRDEHATVFNPVERALKLDIACELSDENARYYFTDIEQMKEFQPHIGRLLTDADLLLEDGESCFEHLAPTFLEKNLLTKASQRKDENIENVRNSFPPKFLEAMRTLVKSHADGISFHLTVEVEAQDLWAEIEEAKEQTEEELSEEE